MSEWPALLYYVRLFLWPDGLSADHDFPYAWSLGEPRASASQTRLRRCSSGHTSMKARL